MLDRASVLLLNSVAFKITSMKKKRYDVLSPDGFAIDRVATYPSKRTAKSAFRRWKKRYEKQGYYSSNNGRIALEDLENFCTLIEL